MLSLFSVSRTWCVCFPKMRDLPAKLSWPSVGSTGARGALCPFLFSPPPSSSRPGLRRLPCPGGGVGSQPSPARSSGWPASYGPVSAQLCHSEEILGARDISQQKEGREITTCVSPFPQGHGARDISVPAGDTPSGPLPQWPGNPIIHGTISTLPATQDSRTLTSGFQRSTFYVNFK